MRRLAQLAARFAFEKIVNATIDVLHTTGNAQNFLAAIANFSPDGAALARAMDDFVRHTSKRHGRAGCKRCRFRQASEARRDPRAMTLREVTGVSEISSRRHGENGLTCARMDAQCVSARPAMAAELNGIDGRADFDHEGARFGGATVKESTKRHVSRSGEREFTGILP